MTTSFPISALKWFAGGLLALSGACDCAAAATVGAKNGVDACLPFAIASADTLFNSQKKVFAHYFYPFPLSIDNKPADQDYYNRNYMSVSGERGKWASHGGYLRQRPLAVKVGSAPNWPLLNMEAEVRIAMARAITGFTIDVMSVKQATDPKSQLHMLLTAAETVDPRFKVLVMPDISALKADSDAVVQIIAAVANSPAAFRLADGKLVVSAFNAGKNSPEWWQGVFSQLHAKGVDVAFVPTFLGWDGKADAFSNLSHGFSDWGTTTAKASQDIRAAPALSHGKYGKVFMMPVGSQQYRPKDSIFWEADNSSAFRNAWSSAIDGGADWVQLVTWSDFSESSQIEPYTDATLRGDIGTGYYDLNAYYASWFLLGTPPVIDHDVLYFFYRREPSAAASPAQAIPQHATNSTASDTIELLAFLTRPGALKITFGSQTFTENAGAGVTSFKIATQPGNPTFSLVRDGSEVFSFQGPIRIFGLEGTQSGVLDMTYWSGSASKNGICTL